MIFALHAAHGIQCLCSDANHPLEGEERNKCVTYFSVYSNISIW